MLNNDEGKCVAGCKRYTGDETYHHKDCYFYPDSMSRLFDEAKEKIKKQESLMKEMYDTICELEMSIDDLNPNYKNKDMNYVKQKYEQLKLDK